MHLIKVKERQYWKENEAMFSNKRWEGTRVTGIAHRENLILSQWVREDFKREVI